MTHARHEQRKPRTVDTRHGKFTIFDEDELVGLSASRPTENTAKARSPFSARSCDRATWPSTWVPTSGPSRSRWRSWSAMVAGLRVRGQRRERRSAAAERGGRTSWPTCAIHAAAASDHDGTLKVDKQSALHAYSRKDINEGEFEVASFTIDSLNLPKVQADQDRRRWARAAGAQRRCRDHRALQAGHLHRERDRRQARGDGGVAGRSRLPAASGIGPICSTSTTCAATSATCSARWSRS